MPCAHVHVLQTHKNHPRTHSPLVYCWVFLVSNAFLVESACQHISLAEQTVEIDQEGPLEEFSLMRDVSVCIVWVSDRPRLTKRM